MRSVLIHYGIKGQKRGLRRYQNEDGSLTEEGRRHYGIGQELISAYKRDKEQSSFAKNSLSKEDPSSKSDRRKALEKRYLEKGFSENQAKIKAYQRENVEKALKIVGAVALVSAAAYGAYKGRRFIQRYSDKTIRKGSAIQRVTSDPTDVLVNRPGFVSPDKVDFSKYRGMYGKQIENNVYNIKAANKINALRGRPLKKVPEGAFAVNGVASSNIKVAGERTGNKVFNDLMKKDPKFRTSFASVDSGTPIPQRWGNKVSDYERFNKNLAGFHNNPDRNYLREKFYGELSKKGYGGVVDLNDRRFSAYYSKRPTILFDLKKSIDPQNAAKLSSDILKKEATTAANTINKQITKEKRIGKLFKNIGKVSLGSTLFTGIFASANAANETVDKKVGAQYRSLIKKYKKEHPNTKLSDDRILENLLG